MRKHQETLAQLLAPVFRADVQSDDLSEFIVPRANNDETKQFIILFDPKRCAIRRGQEICEEVFWKSYFWRETYLV